MVDTKPTDFLAFDDLPADELQAFNQILHNLHANRGVDFRQYRSRCLRRRVVVGMHDANVTTFKEYLAFLKHTPAGYDNLLNRITINVTEFFRNPETFTAVRDMVLPDIVRRKSVSGSKSLRVWSAGCATGQEPYSLAIMLKEYLSRQNADFSVTVFATDIDADALEKAREGRYHEKIFKGVSETQRRAFFVAEPDHHYRVVPAIQSLVKFTRHNMIDDEPLSRMDLIFCRNVVIYFTKELQKRVYENFYHALVPGGYFVAGKTESLMDTDPQRYERIDLLERILRKK